jgi:putative membrane protein
LEAYNYIKALHLIFVVTWFAGLFYTPRLFIYHIEAQKSEEPARSILSGQFKLMSKRLWLIITWPSAILCTLFAIGLLALMPEWLSQGWMHVKLTFVLLLFAYHLKTHQIYKELQRDHFRYSSKFMRLFNEGSTLILFAVVFLVILKSALNWIFATVGFFALAGMLMMGIKIYKRIRDKNPEA